jgi:hypothetical protein
VPDCHRCHDYLREWRPARHLAQDGPAGLTTVAKTVEKRQGRTIGGMGMPANYESAICAACPHQRFTHQRCRRQHPQAMTTAGAKSHTGTAGLPWGPEPRSGSHEQGKGVRPGALRARAGCSMAGAGARTWSRVWATAAGKRGAAITGRGACKWCNGLCSCGMPRMAPDRP